MEDEQEDVREVVLEELARLGVIKTQEGSGKKFNHNGHSNNKTSQPNNNNNNNNNAASKSVKVKSKIRKSPRISGSSSKSPCTNAKPHNDRKHTPKSPFAGSRWRADQKRQQQQEKLQHSKENKAKVSEHHHK